MRKGVFASDAGDANVIVAAVWVNPDADDEQAIYQNNADATVAALTAGRDGSPTVDAVLDAGEPRNPYFRS
jgi:5,6,7,8-tetrahydromethanopterin hydro-lyase